MPYIKKEDRRRIDSMFNVPESYLPHTPGELNYLFTMISLRYLAEKGNKYTTHNDIIGALHNCASEWYRRKTSVLEQKKIKENGDLY